MVELVGDALQAVIGLRDLGGGERVGGNDVGAGAKVSEMNVAHRLRPAQIEQIVVAAHLAVPGVEARAAIALLVELERLDHGAHGAVEHQDALWRVGEATDCGCSRVETPLGGGGRRQRRTRIHGRAVPCSIASAPPQAAEPRMADRVDQVGAVHGVEVELGDAAVDQVDHLLGGDRGGDQLARGRIVIEPVEALGEPGRHRGAGARGEIGRRLEILHRQDARHDRDIDAARAHAVEIAEVEIVLEEELRDGAARRRRRPWP